MPPVYRRSPDQLSEAEVRGYLLHLWTVVRYSVVLPLAGFALLIVYWCAPLRRIYCAYGRRQPCIPKVKPPTLFRFKPAGGRNEVGYRGGHT